MKVKALEAGFFGGFRRRQGDVFEVPEGTKARWLAPVQALGPAPTKGETKPTGEAKPTGKGKGKGKGKEANTLSELARGPASGQTMAEALAPKDDADIA